MGRAKIGAENGERQKNSPLFFGRLPNKQGALLFFTLAKREFFGAEIGRRASQRSRGSSIFSFENTLP